MMSFITWSSLLKLSPLMVRGILPRGGTKNEEMARRLFSLFETLEKISEKS